VTPGDADLEKSPVKTIYRQLSKAASLPVTRPSYGMFDGIVRMANLKKRRLNYVLRQFSTPDEIHIRGKINGQTGQKTKKASQREKANYRYSNLKLL
jgi:hypothetical protein